MNTRNLIFLNIMVYLLMAHSGLALAVTFNSNWDFGNVIIGNSNEYVLTISNDSLAFDSGNLYISEPFWLKQGSTKVQQMPLDISPYTKIKINVGFTPTSIGNFQSNVVYNYCHNAANNLFTSCEKSRGAPFKGVGVYDITPELNLLLD
jgi:hypothetical protein